MFKYLKKLSLISIIIVIISGFLIEKGLSNNLVFEIYSKLYNYNWSKGMTKTGLDLNNQNEYQIFNKKEFNKLQRYINNSLKSFSRRSRNRDILRSAIDQYCNSNPSPSCNKYLGKYLTILFDQKLAGKYSSYLSDKNLIRSIKLSSHPDKHYKSLIDEAKKRDLENYEYNINDWVLFFSSFKNEISFYNLNEPIFYIQDEKYFEIPKSLDFFISSNKKLHIKCENHVSFIYDSNCNIKNTKKDNYYEIERLSKTIFNETNNKTIKIYAEKKTRIMIYPSKKYWKENALFEL